MTVTTSLRWAACLAAAALATAAPSAAATAEELERQIAELRAHYEERLHALEQRLAELEGERESPATALERAVEPPAAEVDEGLAALRAAAEEAAGEVTVPVSPPAQPTVGRERNLNRLNPEISFTGDLVGVGEGGEQDFEAREFELDLQSALDPFSSTKWTLAFSPEEGVEIEEGYITYSGIAPGLLVRAGKMRQSFGTLNRWHLHALPQPDYPLVLEAFFDEEGLAQTGVSVEWLLPRPWATANEVVLQVTDGSAAPFGGGSFDTLAVLGRLKNYWDLSASTYFEWGLSAVVGEAEGAAATRVWGSDLTLHWQPPERGKYRELTWRTEVLRSQRDDELGERQEAWGGYSYLEGLARRNLYLGVRYDRVEDPLAPEGELWAIEPYVSWWQSEFVRLRAAYRWLHDDLLDEDDGRFLLQATWSAGPHKHETY